MSKAECALELHSLCVRVTELIEDQAKREAIETKKVTMKNGKPALEGKCPVCGTKVFKIGG